MDLWYADCVEVPRSPMIRRNVLILLQSCWLVIDLFLVPGWHETEVGLGFSYADAWEAAQQTGSLGDVSV